MREENFVYLTIAVVLALVIFLGGESMSTGGDGILHRMAEAIKKFEGWFPGSLSERNNNPGNLKNIGQPGAIASDNQGHAIFDTYQNGYNALINQLRLIVYGGSRIYNPQMDFYDVFSRYAEANGRQYAEFVAAQLGVSPTTKMSELV